MNNKITTIFLAALLTVLIVLMFLRTCGSGLWNYKNKAKTVKTEDEISTVRKAAVKTEGVKQEVLKLPNASFRKAAVKTEEVKPVLSADGANVAAAGPSSELSKKPAEIAQPPKKSVVASPNPKKQSASTAKPAVKQKDAEKPKISAALKSEIPKTDLPKPAVKKPPREKISKPVFTNKSGFKPFYVYTDIGSKNNHYSPYGLMGDISALSMDQGYKIKPRSGKTCIKITYNPVKIKAGWSGVYWTEPPNNWGDKGYGFNLTGAERISFWAKGEKGTEFIDNFLMGGIQGKKHEDSDSIAIGPVELTKEWKQYFINIGDANLSNIIGGFCFTITKANNPDGAVFYLDDIVYE